MSGEKSCRAVRIVTTETIAGEAHRTGNLVHATAVSGANVLRDMREAITNTLGGRMTRYERLVEATIERALDALSAKAAADGYDAVVAVRISHPVITDGAVEIVVSGTGVWLDEAGRI